MDAAWDVMCQRQFGKAAGTARELLKLAADRWEKGHVIEGRSSGVPGHPHTKAATWGRMIYHQTGNLPRPAGDPN